MSNEFFSVVTNIGKAKIAQAIADESPLGLKHIAVGDGLGNPITPTADMIGLVREVYRGELSTLAVDPQNPNYMIAEVIIPTTEGGWTVHEVGLFDDEGNMIAVANYAASYKPIVAEGSGRDMLIRLIIQVEDGETESLELNIDPAIVLASREWANATFLLSAQIPGGTTGMVLRKASNADGDVEWYDPLSGLNVLVDTLEEPEHTLTLDQDVVTLAVAGTAGAAIYIDGVRLPAAAWTPGPDPLDVATQLTLATPATGGEKLIAVQNEPAAGLEFCRKAQNLADIPNPAVARGNLGVPTAAETLSAVLDLLYPVNEILITMRAGSPETWSGAWTGFGTWERYAAGRALVGYDSTDADFNVLGKIGGAKKHQLTTAEMPAHTHQHNVASNNASVEGNPASGATTKIHLQAASTGAAGSDQPHNNLQPYAVVYMWRRTA